jgi:hypothetical protein
MSRFNLPVFKPEAAAATPAELFRRAMRAESILFQSMGEELPFDFGHGIVSAEFSALTDPNQMRDLTIPPGYTPEKVVADVDAAFAANHSVCRRYTFADGKIPLEFLTLLSPHGYVIRPATLWQIQKQNPLSIRDDLTIIPGRASYPKLAELARTLGAETNAAPPFADQEAEAAVRALDDTRIDNLLALDDETPVGTINLVTAGETGLLAYFAVRLDQRGMHVGSTLFSHAIELAARARLRELMLFSPPADPILNALCKKTGFVPIYTRDSLRLIQK